MERPGVQHSLDPIRRQQIASGQRGRVPLDGKPAHMFRRRRIAEIPKRDAARGRTKLVAFGRDENLVNF